MSTAPFVSKNDLLRAIQGIASTADTGILTILTDTRRSVLLRFSHGKLVQVHCRSRDVGDAVTVINECVGLKYTFVPAQPEHRAELMPVDTFVRMLDPGWNDVVAAPPRDAATSPSGFSSAAPNDRTALLPPFADLLDEDESRTPTVGEGPPAALREALTRVAMNFVGPMAPILVADAMDPWVSVSDTVERIASMIPDEAQARGFRDEALSRFVA